MAQDRRTFLKHSAAALSAASLGAENAIAATPPTEPPRALDATLLRAVGDAVLPEAIGPNGREVAVGAFELWLSDFQPVAELRHPYGGWEIPYGPPDPEPGWSAQLEALDILAEARWGALFASLSADRRREILSEQMGVPTRLPCSRPSEARRGGTDGPLLHVSGRSRSVLRCADHKARVQEHRRRR